MSQSRQLAAIMFTDIVGYTKLMGEDEQAAFELLKKNRSVQRPIIEKFNGRWLKEIGDGVLASFSTVSDAVYCAKEIQETCQDHPDLSLRIGIHQGEVVFEGDDVFGDGVNIASRLEPLAPIGGILVSESVHLNLRNKKGIETNFVQEESLKNVKDPIKTYEVRVEGIESPEPMITTVEPPVQKVEDSISFNARKLRFTSLAIIIVLVLVYFFYSRQGGEETQLVAPGVIDKSIAVLPFINDSPDSANIYFCNGMFDEIITHLQKIAVLKVKSRTSVEQYRNPDRDIRAIGEELEVAYLVEGSVRKVEDNLRITAQLIDAKTGDHFWAETYDGKYTDEIFEFQSNIAKKIASALDVVITPEEEKVIDKFPTTDVAAYELFIRGNHEMGSHLTTGDQKHIHAARKLFDKALLIDPEYYDATFSKGYTFMAERNYDSAFIYVEKLIVLDPKSSAPYHLKGECYYFMGKLDLAIESYSMAINMDTFQSALDRFWVHIQLGRTLAGKGDLISALSSYSKAYQTDYERKWTAYGWLARAFMSIADYDRAARYLQTSMESDANCNRIKYYASVLLVQGKFPQLVQFINSKCDQQACEQQCNQVMFQISLMQGEFVEAAEYSTNWQSIGIDSESFGPLSYMDYEIGYVHYQLGRTDESDKIFKEAIQKLESIDHEAGVPYLHLSRIYAFKGERKKALENLNEFAKRGFTQGWHDFILIDPFFESLRDDPEFKAIVKQVQQEKAELREQVRQMEERGELNFPY